MGLVAPLPGESVRDVPVSEEQAEAEGALFLGAMQTHKQLTGG